MFQHEKAFPIHTFYVFFCILSLMVVVPEDSFFDIFSYMILLIQGFFLPTFCSFLSFLTYFFGNSNSLDLCTLEARGDMSCDKRLHL